jgi:hypothetical protein
MKEPVRGKESSPNLGVYGRSCADADLEWVGDYLHTNEYLDGRRLQAVLNRLRRRRQSPAKAGRGGLSRREWKRTKAAERVQLG